MAENSKIVNPVPIEDSFEKLDAYPTVTERYYTRYHCTPAHVTSDETHCVLVHSNRLCLVTLANTHPVITEKKSIGKIDFEVTEKLDRRNNKVSGKGKRGAQLIQHDSPLCYVECTDGTRYVVRGCVKGKLVEINENLLNNHQLLVDKPLSDGYIALILPPLRDFEEQKKGFTLMDDSESKVKILELLE